ncbi:MAG: DoxX family protein [Bacteroidales bacterium]|nr:DoxX family protein [Bacteroidales bacterium]MDY0217452.1 DoxX family protein [Bacteroidales bacterium]
MIKKIFNPGHYTLRINIALLFLRLIVGTFMLTHGLGKFYALIGDAPIQFPDPLGLGAVPSLALAVFAELFCSILLIFGLFSRLAVIPLLTTMLVAAFVFHAKDGFGAQELALLYTSIYTVIAIAGAGRFSIDNWIYSKLNR